VKCALLSRRSSRKNMSCRVLNQLKFIEKFGRKTIKKCATSVWIRIAVLFILREGQR